MDEKEKTKYKKIYGAAKRLAESSGCAHIAEDFAQDACLKISQGRKTSLVNIFTDYRRQQFGDTRFDSGAQRQLLTTRILSTSPFEESPEHDWTESCIDFRDPRTFPDQFRSLSDLLNGFYGIERAIMILLGQWGMSEVEIGNIFGVSESRISQRLKGIQKRLYARAAAEKSRERKREMEALLLPDAEGESGLEQGSFERMEIGQSWQMERLNEESF